MLDTGISIASSKATASSILDRTALVFCFFIQTTPAALVRSCGRFPKL
jgi:hypothetical protein